MKKSKKKSELTTKQILAKIKSLTGFTVSKIANSVKCSTGSIRNYSTGKSKTPKLIRDRLLKLLLLDTDVIATRIEEIFENRKNEKPLLLKRNNLKILCGRDTLQDVIVNEIAQKLGNNLIMLKPVAIYYSLGNRYKDDDEYLIISKNWLKKKSYNLKPNDFNYRKNRKKK